MNIKHGNEKTKYGPGVFIELSGNEVATAIGVYLVAHKVYINGPRTITVNGNLCQEGQVYVDPSGYVIDDGIKISGRGKLMKNKVIIAGSRHFNDYTFFCEKIFDSGFIMDKIVSGGARGTDALAKRYAKDAGKKIKTFKADWEQYGKAAGPIRNQQMAEYGDCLIAFWNGKSRGTKNMIIAASKKDLPVYIVEISSNQNKIYKDIPFNKKV